LKGFIDLVFEHDGRFYVVDYKSNHLGPMPRDYGASSLVEAMLHHDYFLQYHLYVVAVHRWLSRRLRDYDYERHFGGVYYLFARGMSAEHPGMGVFVDRPSHARTEALSRVLEGAQ
jgi:exodeoxyribonuclease V beta subunit